MDGMWPSILSNLKKENQKLLISQDKTWSSSEPKMERPMLYMLIALTWELIWVWEEKWSTINASNVLSMDGFMTGKLVLA